MNAEHLFITKPKFIYNLYFNSYYSHASVIALSIKNYNIANYSVLTSYNITLAFFVQLILLDRTVCVFMFLIGCVYLLLTEI